MQASLSRAAVLLRSFLKTHDVSQQECADALEVSRVTVSQWLMGHAIPTYARQVAIEFWTHKAVHHSGWPQTKPSIKPYKSKKISKKRRKT
jgi:transcriptional regulator with XRE-family HTH domain